MLDRIGPLLRDLFFALMPVVLGWSSTTLVPILQGVNPILASLVAVVVGALLAYFTKLTNQYGVGSTESTSEDRSPRHVV